MKKYHFLLAIIFLISVLSCSKKSIDQAGLPPDVELQVKAGNFLDRWHLAAAESDLKSYLDKIADQGVYIGTDKTEVWSKSEFAAFSKPYFDKKKGWNFKPIERNLYVSDNDDYIWFDETLDTWMGICRGSGVLQVLPEGGFVIRHYVLSLTIPNEQLDKVIELIDSQE